MKRRDFLAYSAPVAAGALIAIPALTDASTIDDQIRHHAKEIVRLLARDVPDGLSFDGTFSIIRGHITASAYPTNFQHGMVNAEFRFGSGWNLRV